jgi:hypothetical protein
MRRPNGYWKLQTLTDSAKGHDTISSWSKAEMGAYLAARRKGLLESVTRHMLTHGESISRGRTRWTREACLESARNFAQPVEWERGQAGAYQAARRRGWYDECVAHMKLAKRRQGYWTLVNCLTEARKHPTITAWLQASGSSYQVAHSDPEWFAKCTGHMTTLWEKNWSPAAILRDAKKYLTIQEWTRGSVGAYGACHRLGLMAEATAHMEKNPRWLGVARIHRILTSYGIAYAIEKTFPDCKDLRKLPFDFYLPTFNLLIEHHGIQHQRGWAGRGVDSILRRDAIKCDYVQKNDIHYLEIREWEVKNPAAIELLILEAIRAIDPHVHLRRRTLTSKEIKETTTRQAFDLPALRKIARGYYTRAEFKRGNEPAYNFACRYGHIDTVCVHMYSKAEAQRMALTKWTKERVIASARKFRTSREWAVQEGSAYNAALRDGWIEEASAHFPTRTKPQQPVASLQYSQIDQSSQHWWLQLLGTVV